MRSRRPRREARSPPAGAAATQVGAPPAGSVVLMMLPSLLTATQRDSLGQETPVSSSGSPSLATFQTVGPAGFVEVMIVPPVATPTQSEIDGQEMP